MQTTFSSTNKPFYAVLIMHKTKAS